MSNESEEQTLEAQLSPRQIELRTIREKYPVVWDEILKSNICPCNFGLHNSCNLETDNCKKCWELALKIVLADTVTITNAGYYLCKQCNKALVFDKVTIEGEQFWHCPQCETFYKLKLNGDISVIEKSDKDEAAKGKVNSDAFDISGLMQDEEEEPDSEDDVPY